MADDPGTVFDSLDGGSPGSEPMSEDITGVPLPTAVNNGELPDSFAGGESVSAIPGREPPERSAERARAEPAAPAAPSKRRPTAQERIAQLTRHRRAAEGRADDLSTKLEAMTRKLEEQSQQISHLRRAAPTPHTSSHSGSPTNYEEAIAPQGLAPGGQHGGGLDSLGLREVVREELAPLLERTQAIERRDELRQQQQASFAEAMDVLPGLNDPQSLESQTWRELFDNSPLREHPDGPLHVAMMARGVLVESRQEAPERQARKRAASVVTPGPRTTTEAPAQESTRAQQILKEGLLRIRDGSNDDDDWIAARKAQRRMGRGAFLVE